MSLSDRFDNLKLAQKLGYSFSVIIGLMIIIVVANYYGSIRIERAESHINKVLVPLVESELELKNDINASLAALRGYMILGDDNFKSLRSKAWIDIDKQINIINNNIKYLDSEANIKFEELKSVVEKFRQGQNKVESIAHTESESPATAILINEAAPRAKLTLQAITAIIDEEKKLEATSERKQFLGLLADSRGSFAVGLAAVRAYLLSGDNAWKEEFERRWQVNEKRFSDLQKNAYLFNQQQRIDFEKYSKFRDEFSSLPESMFSIRQSNKWNMAHYTLETEVAPYAVKVLDILNFINDNAHNIIYEAQEDLHKQHVIVDSFSILLTVFSLAVGITVARFISGRLVSSINQISQSVDSIAAGNLNYNQSVTSKDEIGDLFLTIKNMQENLKSIIEKDVQIVIDNARKGDLSKMIDVNNKVGCYKELCDSINELLSINARVIAETVDVFSGLSDGDLSKKIQGDYEGDFARIKNDANYTVDRLQKIIQSDVQSIINSASSGNLKSRISLEGKKGFFLDLSEKINSLVDANQTVVSDVIAVFDAMSKGDLRKTIDRQYSGDFDKLKNYANATISQLKYIIEEEIQGVVNAVLEGDLSKRIDIEGKEGFFKDISENINSFADISTSIITDASSVVGAMSEGDLTKSIEKNYKGSFEQLKDHINTSVNHLKGVISQIQEASKTVNTASSEIALGVDDLSSRTEQQATSLEQTAASMQHMMESVEKSSVGAKDASELTENTKKFAIKGGTAVDKAVSAMEGINESSNKISAIIGVIDEIAFQTNLLALNAAVEAARAGEQGRGFAVVASEVRTLAQRSAGAAKEIKDLIHNSVQRVENGSELVNESGTTLKEIIDSVKKVSVAIKELSVSSEEQRDGIHQVNIAVTQMDQMTQQNAALVEESSAASQSMSEQTQKLNDLVGFFTLSENGHSKTVYTQPSYSSSEAKISKEKTADLKKANVIEKNIDPTLAKLSSTKSKLDVKKTNTFNVDQGQNKKITTEMPTTTNNAMDDDDWEEF